MIQNIQIRKNTWIYRLLLKSAEEERFPFIGHFIKMLTSVPVNL